MGCYRAIVIYGAASIIGQVIGGVIGYYSAKLNFPLWLEIVAMVCLIGPLVTISTILFLNGG